MDINGSEIDPSSSSMKSPSLPAHWLLDAASNEPHQFARYLYV